MDNNNAKILQIQQIKQITACIDRHCQKYEMENDISSTFHLLDPAVFVCIGLNKENPLVSGVNDAYLHLLSREVPCKFIFVNSAEDASLVHDKFKKIKEEFINDAVIPGDDVPKISFAFLTQMDTEIMGNEEILSGLKESLNIIREISNPFGFKFFGLFDSEKTYRNGYRYDKQFHVINLGREEGIWEKIFHIDFNARNKERAAYTLSMENIYGNIGTRRNQEAIVHSDHYAWKYIILKRAKYAEQRLSSVLLRLLEKQKVDYSLLTEDKILKQKDLFKEGLNKAMDSQILEFCPLLNPDETEWLFRYAPVVVKKKEIKKLFKKEYYYEIGEIEESYRRELISEYTADCKKNICSKKVLSGLLKKGLENTRILDNSGRESAYLMKAVEELKSQLNASGLVEKEIVRIKMQILDSISEDIISELIQKCIRDNELLSKSLVFILQNEYGQIRELDNFSDSVLQMDIPLIVDLEDTLNEMSSDSGSEWKDVDKVLRDHSAISDVLRFFVVEAKEKAKEKNGQIAQVKNEVTSKPIEQIILLDDKDNSHNVWDGIDANVHVDNNAVYRKNVIMSLCTVEWSSEEALYQYYG